MRDARFRFVSAMLTEANPRPEMRAKTKDADHTSQATAAVTRCRASQPECYLTLPIGPHRLFVATNTEEIERKFKDWLPKELAQEVNSQVAKQAVKYVYGLDHSELGFVDKLISTDRPLRLMERLRDRRRQKGAPA